MKHITALLLALALALALGCGANAFDPIEDTTDGELPTDSEFGTLEQATKANCLSPNMYGANDHYAGAGGWNFDRCGVNDPNARCVFPPTPASLFDTVLYHGLANGWSEAQRAAIQAQGTDASNLVTTAIGEPWRPNGGQPNRFFANGQGGTHVGFVSIVNKPISGTINTMFDFADFSSIVHLTCSAIVNMTNPYVAGTKKCNHWEAVWDYADMVAWATAVPGGNVAIATKNTIAKIEAIVMGLGLDPSPTFSNVTDHKVTCKTFQSSFDGVEAQWVANYRVVQDALPGLTCF